MLRAVKLAFVGVTAFAEMSASPPPDAALIAKAKAAVTHDFLDPAAAQFRAVHVVRSADGSAKVCGEINGKNTYGAYVGFKRFVWDGHFVFLDDPDGWQRLENAWVGC